MADLLFKRGLYSNLHNVAVTDGVVYFTTDTNELYFDDATGRHRMQDVITVATYTELNSKYPLAADKAALTGRLVYITDSNILMTYNGTAWVQINAQKTLQQLVGNLTYKVTAESAKSIVIAQTMGSEGDQVNASYNVRTTTPNMVTLSAVDGDSVNIAVTENRESASITVEEATDGAALKITSIKDTLDTKGEVASTATVKETSVNIVGEGAFTDVHVADGNVVVKTDFDIALAPNEDGQLTLLVKDIEGKTDQEQNVTFKATYGSDSSASANFKKTAVDTMTVDLDVYTIDEIDDMVDTLEKDIDDTQAALEQTIKESLNAANAMTFKGTVATQDGKGATKVGLPTEGVQIGDTYKVAQDGTYILSTTSTDTKYAVVGDLFIATSTTGEEKVAADEKTNTITPAEVKWVHVPSGDDAMYQLWANDGKISLGVDYQDEGKGVIVEGTAIEIVNTTAQKATIKHADVAHDNTTGTAVTESGTAGTTFTAVTGVTVNAQGHVTGVEKSTFNTLGFVPVSEQQLAVSNNTATFLAQTSYKDGSIIDNASLKILSENLEITKDGTNGIKINHPVYNPTTTEDDAIANIEALKFVSGVEYDALGHLKAVTTGSLEIEALAPTSLAATAVANSANNAATFTITETYGDKAVDTLFGITSNTLAITNVGTSNEKVALNLIWGSF